MSAVIARLPAVIASSRLWGTCSARAKRRAESPSGFMKSSSRISPGWTGGILGDPGASMSEKSMSPASNSSRVMVILRSSQ